MLTVLLVGGGGREASFARHLGDSRVCAVMPHANPLIASVSRETGGSCRIGDPADPAAVVGFARECRADLAFVSADAPLEAGVVDALLEAGVGAVGGTREASRIEWDKVYSMGEVVGAAPGCAPFHRVARDEAGVREALSELEGAGMEAVVKPQGLTGGKGVKVMPEHLATYADCGRYAAELLGSRPGEAVLLVERLRGPEFTVMGLTDGREMALAPATYDYPYRLEGDRGPGTGGMGCFTGPGGRLPFLGDGDVEECGRVMRAVLGRMRAGGLGFSGVLNGGFFKTREGIRFMEFNARFGDPECLNVLSLLEGPLSGLLLAMRDGGLRRGAASFRGDASVTKYLVAPEYPGAGRPAAFEMDGAAIAGSGVDAYPASCVGLGGGRYETLGTSRAVALGAVAGTVEGASEAVERAIAAHVRGPLEHRRDVGSAGSLAGLRGAGHG